MRARNYYDILGIDPDATQEETRSAYYIRARVIHPDRFNPHSQKREWQKANEMLAELNEAYAVLRDASKRSEYDREMGFSRTTPPSATSSQGETGSDKAHGSQSQKKRDSHHDSRKDAQTQESTATKPGPTHLTFSALSSDSKERLLGRRRGIGRHLGWRTKNLWIEIACIIGAFSWISTLFYWSADYRWTRTQLLGFGGLTIASSLAIAFGILGLWRWNKFPMRGAIFLTPLYFIKCRYDDIWYWGLWQICDVQPFNHYRNGSYTHTTVTFIFDEGKESVSLNNQKSLNHLFDSLKTWNTQTFEAFKGGDWEYFAQHDDFFDMHGQLTNNRTAPRAISGRVWSVGLLITLACGLAITALADNLNGYFDDKKSWDDAAVNNRVSAYRKYLQNHPSGRWALDANKRIQQQYDVSSLNYQTSRSRGFDENASAAVVGILNYAKQTQHYRVRVAFERHNEIPKNIEDQLRRQFEVATVLSIGDSFSDQRMQTREQQILSSVTSAFKSIIPEDILEFTDSGGVDQGVAFIINYKVRSGKSLYFRDTDSQIDPYSRPYYPGIYLSWDFEIRVPSQQGYRFTLESKPASEFRYTYTYGSETATVYDRMAESAFDDFRRELVKRLGLSAANVGTPSSQPTPSPTPDVTGIYANQVGRVDIKSNVTGFSFALKVGTVRCEGEISGRAKWLRGSNAVYRVPLEKEVYEDPSSFYYQKTCKLTFSFSENEVKVTQSDGCAYFHGAECDFNGVYRR